MKYAIFKLDFHTGVHFGTGMLNDSIYTFRADTLFSALYIEALKNGTDKKLLQAVTEGNLKFTDAFPYVGSQYMIPKPMLYIEPANKGDSAAKKKYKKLKYIPVDQLDQYLKGELELNQNPMNGYGSSELRTSAAVRKEDATLPYHIGTYHYNDGNGLYVIVGFEHEEDRNLFTELLTAVSFTGIGGKRSSGLGKFKVKNGEDSDILYRYLNQESDQYMLLSVGLPPEDELEDVLDGASYLLEKRSGFIASDTYAEELRKKQDLYVFTSGSCFNNKFSGRVYDVSDGGSHPVYRYAIPFFMGV